ncbi:MAG: DNA polymerase III subunit [Phycisphaerales bacterium]
MASLRRAFESGRLAHAYIFDGIDGVGKYTTAKAFAKLLLCQSTKEEIAASSSITKSDAGLLAMTDSCGKCESCRMMDVDNHPDFHHIYKELVQFSKEPENRKKQPIDLPIAVIREFLLEKIQIRPGLSASKVFVISESEKLNAASQNALLKILEEPPHGSFIILLCSKLDNLLPTTKSRSQIIHFGPLSEEKIIEKLEHADKNQVKFLARLTNGSIGQSELLTKLEPSFYELKKEFLNKFAKFQLADIVDFAQWINTTAGQLAESWVKLKAGSSKADLGRAAKKIFVLVLISALSDAMKVSFAAEEKFTNFDQLQAVKAISQRFGQVGCSDLIELCYETIRYIDASVNEKLVFEHLLLNSANYGITI